MSQVGPAPETPVLGLITQLETPHFQKLCGALLRSTVLRPLSRPHMVVEKNRMDTGVGDGGFIWPAVICHSKLDDGNLPAHFLKK